MSVQAGDTLYAYVYLDPDNPPSQVMLQWNPGGTWERRAYWGANLIPFGVDGTDSRRYMGPLPVTGQWVRLEVPASLVGLEGAEITGMAFTLYDGRATWDQAGATSTPPYPKLSFSGNLMRAKKYEIVAGLRLLQTKFILHFFDFFQKRDDPFANY